MMRSLATKKQQILAAFNRFGGWILFFAIIWLCWNIARLTWLVLAPPTTVQLATLERQSQPQMALSATEALSVFASPQTNKAATPAASPPDATLVGVMLAQPATSSSAILEVDGAVANYRVGEQLQNTDYELVSVSWRQAVLADITGKQVVLDMPQAMSLDQPFNEPNAEANKGIGNRRLPSGSASAAGLLANRGNNRADDDDSNDNTQSNLAAADEQPDQPSSDTVIDNAVSELKQNSASYLSQMGVMATSEGYQITDAMPSKIKNRLGLESGDRVLSVNGQSVGSNPASDADLLNQVKRSGEAVIKVQRGEQVITIRQQI